MYRFVERPEQFPNRCAVLPQLGHDHERGYLDVGQDMPQGPREPHVYVSVQAVEELAKEIGMASKHEVEALEALIASLSETIDAQEAELVSLREFEQSAQYTLERFGTKVRKKPGRKPKQEDPVAA